MEKEDWFVIFGLFLFIFVIIMGLLWAKSYQCEQTWKDSGVLSKWSFSTGCLIQKDNKWLPANSYRNID